ncbi:MAG: ABC transporter ATP-binding protein, partial [Cyanobium sp.]
MTQPVLRLAGLSVRYPQAERFTLQQLDLELNPGETLALVGPSGCATRTGARAVRQLRPRGRSCRGSVLLAGQDPRQLS